VAVVALFPAVIMGKKEKKDKKDKKDKRILDCFEGSFSLR